MAEITASMVRELRDRTGVAMMDCKAALTETGGNTEEAVALLRKKGQAKQDKLSTREATEGCVGVVGDTEGRAGAIVEINCNTDFTARSEPVIQLAAEAAQALLHNPEVDIAQAASLNANITEVAQKTGENIRVGRTAFVRNAGGKVGTYSHYTGRIGILVSINGDASDELVKDLCLHIAATRPLALKRDELPADVVAKEREIAVEQAKATGKPAEIAEKIAEGKMRTFYEDRVLLDQKFVKDDKKTIAQLLKENSAELVEYVRIEVGQ